MLFSGTFLCRVLFRDALWLVQEGRRKLVGSEPCNPATNKDKRLRKADLSHQHYKAAKRTCGRVLVRTGRLALPQKVHSACTGRFGRKWLFSPLQSSWQSNLQSQLIIVLTAYQIKTKA